MSNTPLIVDRAAHEARKYWRSRLASMSFEGHLPLDHPRPRDGHPDYASVVHRLDEDVHLKLQRLTAGNPFLTYTALVLSLKIGCSRYSGNPNVTIACPGTSEGLARNQLPIGSTVERSSTFKQALLATKELLGDAYRYEQYPVSRILLDIPEPHRPDRFPMSASLAAFNGDRFDAEVTSDIAVVFDTVHGTTATCRVDRRLYDQATILHFLTTVGAILQQGLSGMSIRIADLVQEYVRTPAGRTAHADARHETPVHRLIERWAERRPGAVAIVEGDRLTTYRALDRAANELAATLGSAAGHPAKPVGILLDPGTAFVIGMYGVLQGGAAFLPLMRSSATKATEGALRALGCERVLCRAQDLPYVRQLAAAGTAVTSAVTVEVVAEHAGYRFGVVDVGPDGAVPQESGETGPPAPPEEAHAGAACVLVEGQGEELVTASVSHRELVRLFGWLNERHGIGCDDRSLAWPSMGPCEQLYATLGMLIAGASIEIGHGEGPPTSAALAQQLIHSPSTVWVLATGLIQNLLPSVGAFRSTGDSHGPRAILLTGEKQWPQLAQSLRAQFPGTQITGLYAPPALRLWTTSFDFDHDGAESAAVVAQAIPGFEHRVLHVNGEAAPVNVTGALYVGGEAAADGLGRQHLPTGLRARWLDSTRMRWLRGDDHRFVKYGCSVELTQLEAVLCEHGEIRAAEVLATGAAKDGRSPVVAFMFADASHLSADAARDFVVLHGVDLVPDRFIVLEEFPLLPDGTIDRETLVRGALMSQEGAGAADHVVVEAVRAALRDLWLESLQLDAVEEDESFFASGGNSLKATLLIARIREDFGVHVSVQSFFRNPTIGAVAALIAATSTGDSTQQAEPDVQAVPREQYRMTLQGREP